MGPNPPPIIQKSIVETKALLAEMERELEDGGTMPAELRDRIRAYNRRMLAYSTDQIIPMPRPFGGRWFDDFTVPAELIEACRQPQDGSPIGPLAGTV